MYDFSLKLLEGSWRVPLTSRSEELSVRGYVKLPKRLKFSLI